jgi:hypothetical protein
MTTSPAKDTLLANLNRVVQDTLAYFEGPGRTTTARVDRWQARDVLMHFLYFHDATAWGIQSVAMGGPAWPVPADADTVNEVCRRLHEHESVDELLAQVRQAHARLVRAVTGAPDLDRPCFRRSNGETMTGRQRLELLARHWTEHVRELQQAAGAR